jgi:hypothetical protein
VGLNSLKSLNLTNGYPNKNKNNNNKVKSKPLELRSRVKTLAESTFNYLFVFAKRCILSTFTYQNNFYGFF